MKTRSPRSSIWREIGHYRRRIILSAVIVASLSFVWQRLAPSMSGAGFGFLFDVTGWDMGSSILPYTSKDPYWWALLVGLMNTIAAGTLGIVGATVLGFVVGVARSSTNKLLSDIARLYVDVIRNIPVILQAMFWYTLILHFPPTRSSREVLGAVYLSNRGLYIPKFTDTVTVCAGLILVILLIWSARSTLRHLRDWRTNSRSPFSRSPLMGSIGAAIAVVAIIALTFLAPELPSALVIDRPALTGLNFTGGLRIPPEFAALAAAVTVYRGAFMGEIFRGGFAAVSPGQIDAAKSLGLRPWMVLWKIRLPLALISIVPPISSEYIIIMKVTSIGIVVGFWDLFAVSSHSANLTGRSLEVLFTMMLIYLVLNYSVSTVMNVVNRRVRARGFDTNA